MRFPPKLNHYKIESSDLMLQQCRYVLAPKILTTGPPKMSILRCEKFSKFFGYHLLLQVLQLLSLFDFNTVQLTVWLLYTVVLGWWQPTTEKTPNRTFLIF